MKTILNSPDSVVGDMLAGLSEAHSDIVRVDLAHRLCLPRRPLPAGKEAVISGGGSGHEPLHARFVGEGMLTSRSRRHFRLPHRRPRSPPQQLLLTPAQECCSW
ncbi:dihydroxyacetone kinase subunit DhaK [Streptomyces sp. 205]|uniref:Dihydroxyacetone kinase subunit DhaK n=1 Tax=Streptomyces coffeae TaxID=621382 RepID=A0ABS1NHF5_9ACTN|nr:dihydroxyacetone kinase subunit DhaK [Streptomyces coffeae]